MAQVTPKLLVTNMSAEGKVQPKLLATTLSANGKVRPVLLVTTIPKETISVTLSCDTSRSISNVVTIEADTSRAISNVVTISADTLRNIGSGVTINADTSRKICTTETIDADTSREIVNSIVLTTINADTSRTIVKGVTIGADTSRKISNEVTINADTCRELIRGVYPVTLSVDTKRELYVNTTITADTSRDVRLYARLSLSTKRNIFNSSIIPTGMGKNVLTLKPKKDLDNVVSFDSIVNFDFNGGINTQGTYQIPSAHRIYNSSGELSYVNVDIDAEAYNINPLVDLIADFNSVDDFDGTDIGAKVRVIPYLRLSDDNVNYSNWQTALSGTQYKAKYYDFKIDLITNDANVTVVVNKFGFSVYR